jgi:uncharacterized membrane protein HdeD (DUF308 family)
MKMDLKTEWYLVIGLLLMVPLLIIELKPFFWYVFAISLFGLFLIFYGISKCDRKKDD